MSNLSLVSDNAALVETYEALSTGWQFLAGQRLISRLGVTAGNHVLDIGSGTGQLTAHTAGIVGSAGRVTGIEPLALRVEVARKRERENLSFLVGSAYDLGMFSSESFDVVYLNFVFHWLEDKELALRQIRRVLKPGGKLGIWSGSRDHPSEIVEIRQRVLSASRYAAFAAHEKGRSRHITVAEYEALFAATGFSTVSIELVPTVNTIPGAAEDALAFLEASSFGNYLGHLPDELRKEARLEILAELRRFEVDGEVRLRGMGIQAVAVAES